MLLSPAKLNLGLRIVGRRPDGYHLLESLFWPINFADKISLQVSTENRVICQWAKDAAFSDVVLLQNEKNLVGQLLRGTQDWKPKNESTVRIEKRIPIGGGLGGVSSNVGTVLRHLQDQEEITKDQAERLALQFGADVPFFLNPRPSWVTGVGEVRSPLSLAPELKNSLFFLLVLFPFGTSTPELFQAFRERTFSFSPSIRMDTNRTWDFDALSQFLKSSKNDLETLVANQTPSISSALELLRLSQPLYSGLSGTGSTCFGIYSSTERRAEAAKEFEGFYRRVSCRIIFAETY